MAKIDDQVALRKMWIPYMIKQNMTWAGTEVQMKGSLYTDHCLAVWEGGRSSSTLYR